MKNQRSVGSGQLPAKLVGTVPAPIIGACWAVLVAILMCAPAGLLHARFRRDVASHVSTSALARPAAARAKTATKAAPAPKMAEALFVKSDLALARSQAAVALTRNTADVEAWFVEMEAAALQADTSAALEAALRLCELPRSQHDARSAIAAARILDLAANTSEFRRAVPRIQKLVTAAVPETSYLRAALVAAAADGLPDLSTLELARQSGLITDWRLAGPFGKYPNVAYERSFGPERDGLRSASYDGRAAEEFRFDDGNFNLPDYFSTAGIFYAASDVSIANDGEWIVRAETAGSLEVFIDGTRLLNKDDRFHTTPEITWEAVQLSAGIHRLLVKFLPSTSPFRIAVLPRSKAAKVFETKVAFEPESAYVQAAKAYWAGDYNSVIAQLTPRHTDRPAAVADFLLAQAWARTAPDSAEEIALLDSALELAPGAMAAEYQRAARLYTDERIEDAFRRVNRVVKARPEFAPAQHLLAETAVRLKWEGEAAKAHEAQLRLHPSCEAVRNAARFFASTGALTRARQIETRLSGCAPGSLAYAEALGSSGRHAESAAALMELIASCPLGRDARALLVRELLLAGNVDAARHAAQDLVALAPNALGFRRLAEAANSGKPVLDHSSESTATFAAEQQFYSAYRRDGREVMKKTAHRHFSGGPAVVLLHDRVARLAPDGSVSVYVHKLTRVLDRDGIEKYGEVTLPRSAKLLELRTLKTEGGTAEPEFNQHKSSISMPALAPGDVIEQEYVIHSPDAGPVDDSNLLQFTFGSFSAPILYSRFVVLSPADSGHLQIVTHGDVPAVKIQSSAVTGSGAANSVPTSEIARIWERDNIAQSAEEVSVPDTDLLPIVHVVGRPFGGWLDLRDRYRDELIEAVRIGTRVEQNAQRLHGRTPLEIAETMYRMVTTRIRNTESSFAAGEVASAEGTLAGYAGSRTVALLGMATAAGIEADLLLGRSIDHSASEDSLTDLYSHPLVLFHFRGLSGARQDIVVDVESDGLGFGALPPTISRSDALLVPVQTPKTEHSSTSVPVSLVASQTVIGWNGAPQPGIIVPIPATTVDEQSIARGEVTLDGDGNLTAQLEIRMGVSRGAQMRTILAGIEPRERTHFFEQLATRIFPGTAQATGEVRNELDPDHPLELRLRCWAPRFVNFSSATAEIDQLVPALGLRKMYLNSGTRKLPLYIDVPLVETATFRLQLPPTIRVTGQPDDSSVENEFGSYSVQFRQPAAGQFEIQRSFRIPVQVIAPGRFDAFSRFARQIDDAERQRISLGSVSLASALAAN